MESGDHGARRANHIVSRQSVESSSKFEMLYMYDQ